MPRRAQSRNLWPFGPSAAQRERQRIPARGGIAAHTASRPGAKRKPTTAGTEYKGYSIRLMEDGSYVIPKLDPESQFEDLKQAKRFIDSERKNPNAHTFTIAAYERKAELGGGFRGVILDRRSKQRTESEVLPTLEAARHWAKQAAHRAVGGQPYSLAPYRRTGEYLANVWTAANPKQAKRFIDSERKNSKRQNLRSEYRSHGVVVKSEGTVRVVFVGTEQQAESEARKLRVQGVDAGVRFVRAGSGARAGWQRNGIKKTASAAARSALQLTDAISGDVYKYTVGLPSTIAHGLLRNPHDLGDSWIPLATSLSYAVAAQMKRGFERRDIAAAVTEGTGRQKGKFRVYVHRTDEGKANRAYPAVAHEARESYMRARRGNPSDEAASMYESFHGRPADREIIVQEEVHEHEHLSPLGILVNLKVKTLSGYDLTTGPSQKEAESEDYDETVAHQDTVYLSSNEEGTQLYFTGGDQSLDLSAFQMDTDEWEKDDMIIGVLYEVTYRTKKKFDKFKLTDYYHQLGEETGDQPLLRYEPLSPHLYVTGGKYRIEKPSMGMSPGIEN